MNGSQVRLSQSARLERVDVSGRIAEANAHRSSRKNGRSIRIDGAKCADRLGDWDGEDMWWVVAHHLPELLFDDQTHGMSTILARQDAVEGCRSAASLQMSQHDASHILVDSLLEFLGDDAARFRQV